MPDWLQHVKSRLGPLGLDPHREAEIIVELASHLEHAYEDLRRLGLSVEEAMDMAFRSVSDWEKLSHDICTAERGEDWMSLRLKCLWLPGLVTLTLSASLLWVMTRAGLQPKFVGNNPHESILVHLPWLVSLPAIAAIGCFGSKRAGGGRLARLLTGLFPVLALAVVFMVLLPLALVLDLRVPAAVQFKSFAFGMLNHVLVPGVALFVGTLPFMRGTFHASSPRIGGASHRVGVVR